MDCAIASELLHKAISGDYDHVVLFAGDSDFAYPVRTIVRELKKTIWIVGFGQSVAGDLKQYTFGNRHFIDLLDHVGKLLRVERLYIADPLPNISSTALFQKIKAVVNVETVNLKKR